MIDFGRAINILAENVHDLKEKQRYNSLQRRNQVVDMYGYELVGHGTANKPAEMGVSISPDMIHYNRNEYQIKIENSSSNSFRFMINGIDLTPYFQSQFNGAWVNKNGVFPNKGTAHYDVLSAVGYMTEKERNEILDPGYKVIQVYGNGDFDVRVYPYIKYNHCNR